MRPVHTTLSTHTRVHYRKTEGTRCTVVRYFFFLLICDDEFATHGSCDWISELGKGWKWWSKCIGLQLQQRKTTRCGCCLLGVWVGVKVSAIHTQIAPREHREKKSTKKREWKKYKKRKWKRKKKRHSRWSSSTQRPVQPLSRLFARGLIETAVIRRTASKKRSTTQPHTLSQIVSRKFRLF